MPEISVERASLVALTKNMQSLAVRTDNARRFAIGCTAWQQSSVDDAPLGCDIDWFYRRSVQLVEGLRDLMSSEARGVAVSNATYTWTDTAIGRDIEPRPPGRMRQPG